MAIQTADVEARFVRGRQYLLTEGKFVNTYKSALLLSLTRWPVEHPGHDERQPVDVREFALHFAALYWPHVRPFRVAGERAAAEREPAYAGVWRGVLVQDRGARSEHQIPHVLKQIRGEHQSDAASFD